ncbi:glucose/arabinose dehydrogenase [Deinobacterium chartae]|uniref:Glucose/arabinose dehydrogenase n=1 Tax=Deinobacterium chartae TaxID=521158 RepID=A0A841I589_9DEIO|nr:PQQ-dependent sugar dehydrogenase [Deinobacterium chartae]MBB6099112.1 glucose/arabinose dehydrogenase [Deinobacterium chartae]
MKKLVLLAALAAFSAQAQQARTLISGLEVPWDLTFAPDGALYFTERGGRVSRYQDGKRTTLARLEVRSGGEAGLMGLALEPDFPKTPHIYLCYSYSEGGAKNKISRFTLSGNRLGSERTLLANLPGGAIHNGCRLTFGPDGKLYATTGDAGNAALAQQRGSLGGKILRLNKDGSVPDDNPFKGSPVYSLGHRNPQGLIFVGNRLYSTEHGPGDNDEVNRIQAGKNYGWPEVGGTRSTARFTGALKSYSPTLAVSGLDALNNGDLILTSLKAGQLRRLRLEGDRVVSDRLLVNGQYGRLRDVAVGPDGKLYVATSNRDGRGTPRGQDDRILVIEP